jgi:hypothetical protein
MGVPVDPKLAGKYGNRDILCAELEWWTDLATVLVHGGAARGSWPTTPSLH